jgi:hypothetical protein
MSQAKRKLPQNKTYPTVGLQTCCSAAVVGMQRIVKQQLASSHPANTMDILPCNRNGNLGTSWPVAQWPRHRNGNRLIISLNPKFARLWLRPCGAAWDAVPKQMVEYFNP